MFGDRAFFGESPFQTPAQPQQNTAPVYTSGPAHSGVMVQPGVFTGYREVPNQGLQFFERNNQTS